MDAAGSDDGADEDYGAERAREERNEVIAAAMDTAAAVAVAVDAGGERAAGSAPPDGKRAAQKALLKAIGDVDAMLLRWGPLQVEEAIQAMASADVRARQCRCTATRTAANAGLNTHEQRDLQLACD